MQRTIQTTYRYRLDSTAEQEIKLNQFAGARRFVWNWALNRKREHFRQTGKTLSYHELAAELTQLKQQSATAWLREMDSQSLQQALRDLDSAYQHLAQRAPPPGTKRRQEEGLPEVQVAQNRYAALSYSTTGCAD
jgi:putative transposase